MHFKEAEYLLNKCDREESRDHAFGDAEVFWSMDGQEIAEGYFGGGSRTVHILIVDSGINTFNGVEANALRLCGKLKSITRNDETGPDTYSEGTIVPGLTKEAILKELKATENGG